MSARTLLRACAVAAPRVGVVSTRLAARSIASSVSVAQLAREFDEDFPKARDNRVDVIFVDAEGVRTRVAGQVGDTIMEAAHRGSYTHLTEQGISGTAFGKAKTYHADGDFWEPTFGEGITHNAGMVILPKNMADLALAPQPDELEQLEEYPFPEDLTKTSRLAECVILTKEMNNMVVYVPDGPETDIP